MFAMTHVDCQCPLIAMLVTRPACTDCHCQWHHQSAYGLNGAIIIDWMLQWIISHFWETFLEARQFWVVWPCAASEALPTPRPVAEHTSHGCHWACFEHEPDRAEPGSDNGAMAEMTMSFLLASSSGNLYILAYVSGLS